MSKLRIYAGVATFFLFLSTAKSAVAEITNPEVSFVAVGKPSFIKIKGEAKKLTHKQVVENGAKVEVFEFPLKELSTGIDMRDEHMKNTYLEVNKYPTATLKIPATDKSPFDFAGEKTLQGNLTLHGQTKPVSVNVKHDGTKVLAEYDIKLSDFGIPVPEWSGITVADSVNVNTKFEPVLDVPVLAR